MVLRNIICPLCRLKPKFALSSTYRKAHELAEGKNKTKKGKLNDLGEGQLKGAPKVGGKSSPEVLSFLESPRYDGIRDRLPKSLLRKYRTPETMYVIDKATTRHLVDIVASEVNKEDTLLEVNPGLGLLTEELLKTLKNEVHLFEMSQQYAPFLEELESKYPGRVHYKIADFFGMWKLSFRDKMDNGTRIKDLMGDLANAQRIKVVGAMPSLNFIKHLIYTILFHNTTNILGRPELFIAMPNYNLAYLQNGAKVKQKPTYRATPALFQLLFDYKVLGRVPRSHFLPWQFMDSKKAELMEEDCMFIVKITQKETLPCQPECLPLLWYFFQPHMMYRTNRVIPSLEQLVPGAGVWLISGQDPPDTNVERAPGKDDAPLPHMTIFTQYGDLSLQQKLTVFKRFVSWPEFEQCPFRLNMENNLPRSVAEIDEKDMSSAAATEDTDIIDLDEEKQAE